MTPEQTVEFLIEQFRNKGIAQFHIKQDQLGKKTKDLLIQTLGDSVKAKNAELAKNLLSILCVYDLNWTVNEFRERGTLRPSKYEFETQIISYLIESVLFNKLYFNLSSDNEKWVKSVLALCSLATGVNQEIVFIKDALENGGMPLLKSLLVMTDYAFMLRDTMGLFTQFNSDSPADAEEIADGFSYIFHLYIEKFGNTHLNINVNVDWILDDTCLELLLKAFAVKSFFNKEVMVDRFGYVVEKKSNGLYEIFDPADNLEKSMRIGYLSNIMQGLKQDVHLVSQKQKIASMREFGKLMYDALKDDHIKLVKEPFERYVFAVVYHPEFIKMVTEEKYFLEEEGVRLSAERDLLVHWKQLFEFIIIDDITFWDLLKVQRFFNILRWYIVSHFNSVLNEDYIKQIPLVLQSILSRFTDEKLIEGLKEIVGEAKAVKIVDLLTWKPNDKVFDIQYQPMLPVEKGKLIPLNVLASSNIVRNTLQRCGKRFYPDGKIDPVSVILKDSLKSKMQHAEDDVNYYFNGKAGQLDVIAQSDNTLFIFECKNSLLPCNMHELRTSYDYVITAGKQLTRFCELFKDEKFRKYLQKTLRWSCVFDESTQVYTGIIMSNRMFSGYRVGPHPVRGLGEIVTFVDNGQIGFNGKYFCIWRSKSFNKDELKSFLSEDVLHRPIFDSMIPATIEYVYDRYRLIYRTFNLDMERLLAAYNLTPSDVLEVEKPTEKRNDD